MSPEAAARIAGFGFPSLTFLANCPLLLRFAGGAIFARRRLAAGMVAR
jgi:hypothetical protein